jgi:hypothetical protein
MKKRNSITQLFGLLTFTLLIASCATPEKVVEAERVNNREGTGATAVTEGRIQGTVQSVRGVMDELSCYCGNGAYITNSGGGKSAVCFADNVNLEGCVEIEVSGIYETVYLESDENNPCPSGEMSFMRVKKYTCKSANR